MTNTIPQPNPARSGGMSGSHDHLAGASADPTHLVRSHVARGGLGMDSVQVEATSNLNLNKAEYRSGRTTWTIVGLVIAVLLLVLIVWFVWWMMVPREPLATLDRGPANMDVRNMNSRNIHACGTVTVRDKLSVCNVASFPKGIIAPHISAGCEDAVHIHDPLICRRAFVRPVYNDDRCEIPEFSSGVNNCTNQESVETTGYLPESRKFAGSTTVTVNNRTCNAHVIVRVRDGDQIQNRYQGFKVGNSVQFESDGLGSWWVH